MSSSADYHGGDSNVLYSEQDIQRQSDAFRLQLFFLRLGGQVPMKLAFLGWFGPVIGKCYCIFCILTGAHMACLFIKTTYDMLQYGELEDITDALTMANIYIFATFGTCYWFFRSQSLIEFINELNTKYRHHSMAGITFVNINRPIQLSHKITLYWQASAFIVGTVFMGLAIIILGIRVLPLKCWYPFDPLQPIVYEILYVLQLWCQCQMGIIFGNGSAIFVSVIFLMLGQLDVLYCSLKNFDHNAHIIAGKNLKKLRSNQKSLPPASEDEPNQYIFGTEYVTSLSTLAVTNIKFRETFRDALRDSLVECVHLHQFILKSCDTLEELFNIYCLVKSMQITFQLCLLAFVGVAGKASLTRTINLMQYLVLTMLELIMFTYCGEVLGIHSIRVGEALWRSQWWVNGHLIKRDILIFLINSQRAVKLTAGKFFIMDIQRLRSVVAQAFSFLTLLQNLAEQNN